MTCLMETVVCKTERRVFVDAPSTGSKCGCLIRRICFLTMHIQVHLPAGWETLCTVRNSRTGDVTTCNEELGRTLRASTHDALEGETLQRRFPLLSRRGSREEKTQD